MLQNKIILLTGGADGIGWECAQAYSKAGALVCIADKSPEGQNKIGSLSGSGHQHYTCNISNEKEVENF